MILFQELYMYKSNKQSRSLTRILNRKLTLYIYIRSEHATQPFAIMHATQVKDFAEIQIMDIYWFSLIQFKIIITHGFNVESCDLTEFDLDQN